LKIVNTISAFYGIRISGTSIAYNNVVPYVIQTQTLNIRLQWAITNHHIFEFQNLFMAFSIRIQTSFVFC
jgi:hypothetical protein